MQKQNLRPAVIGKDGRTTAIEKCLERSPRVGGAIIKLSDGKDFSPAKVKAVLNRARETRPDFVIIGPEEPLAHGIVDDLQKIGIPCVGPTKKLAQLESSKAFTRDLLAKYNIPGNPEYRVFETLDGIEDYLKHLGEYVVKPDGLTGGKGVRLSGPHLHSIEHALEYCSELILTHKRVVIEEKLDGEEFSLQAFCDGTFVHDMIVVQDHKRAHPGDTGPNTGGMGSYSCEDHSLPFLEDAQLEEAKEINKAVADALLKETKEKYKGILYGGFMLTRNGIRLLEYNARFGDPETLNVLSLLKTDLVDICEAIIEGKLDTLKIEFKPRASVCKYVVPEGYPTEPVKDELVDLGDVPMESENLKIYRAGLNRRGGKDYLNGSRTIAFVGIGKDLEEAQLIAEAAASAVKGRVFHRSDIGTRELVQQRVDHVRSFQASHSVLA